MAAVDLARAAQELYGAPPGAFLATRTRLVASARSEGDAQDAKALASCAKPVLAAWLVNLLAREREDDVRSLLDVGERLRDAQDALDATGLREATGERRAAVGGLLDAAAALATGAGGTASQAALDRVADTLTAATLDAGAAAAIASGRLLRPLVGGGLDPVDLMDAVALPGLPPLLAAGPSRARRPPPHRASAERAARERAAQERIEQERAERALRAAERDAERAADRLAQRGREAEDARAGVDAAQEALRRARSAARAAERALDDAADASAAAADALERQRSSSRTARASSVAPATAAGIATTATGGTSSSR